MRYIKANVIPSNILELPTLQDATGGEISSFETDLALALNKLKIAFSASQDLHGYSKPWIGGAGKNKFNSANVTLKKWRLYANAFQKLADSDNRIQLTINANESITATTTENYVGFGFEVSSVNYDRVFSVSSEVGKINLYDSYQDGATTIVSGTKTSVSIPANTSGFVGIRIDSTTPLNLFCQIESGSSATSWEPYSNICPITGFSQANVTRTGANIIGGETFADIIVSKVPNATKDTSEKTVTYQASTISNIELFNKFKPNTVYTIFVSTKSGVSNLKVVYTDNSATTLSVGLNTTASGKSVASIMGLWSSGTTVLYYDQFGVFEGSLSAGDFIPYHGNTYLIQFGDTYYGGVLDVTTGKLRVIYEMYVFTGSEAYGTLSNNRIYCTFLTNAYIPTDGTEKCVISSHYKGGAQNGYSSGEIYKSTGNVAIVFVDDVNGVDTTTFKAFLANQYSNGTPVTAVYKLATPIEVDIDSAIITALTGEVNQVYCDIPTSTVEELQFFETVGRHIG